MCSIIDEHINPYKIDDCWTWLGLRTIWLCRRWFWVIPAGDWSMRSPLRWLRLGFRDGSCSWLVRLGRRWFIRFGRWRVRGISSRRAPVRLFRCWCLYLCIRRKFLLLWWWCWWLVLLSRVHDTLTFWDILRFYNIGWNALAYTYMVEIFPFQQRAKGIAVEQLAVRFAVFFNSTYPTSHPAWHKLFSRDIKFADRTYLAQPMWILSPSIVSSGSTT